MHRWILWFLVSVIYVNTVRGVIIVQPSSNLNSVLANATNNDVFSLTDGTFMLSATAYLSVGISIIGTRNSIITCSNQVGITTNGSIAVSGVTFLRCSIALELGGVFNISNTNFENNFVGINALVGSGTISSSSFVNNEHGIRMWGSSIILDSCTFAQNANGIFSNPSIVSSELKVYSSNFVGNYGTDSEASGISIKSDQDSQNQNIFIINTSFFRNNGTQPSVHTIYAKSVSITSCSFTENYGTGNIIVIEYGLFSSSDNSFVDSSNSRVTELYYVNSTSTKDFYFNNNRGTLGIHTSSLIMESSKFDSNGGSVFSEYSVVQADNSVFQNNYGSDGGGYLQQDTGTNAKLIFSNCIFVNNSATSKGGGLAFYGAGTANFQSCSIINNNSPLGGGLYVEGNAEIIIVNSDVSNNIATSGGAIYNKQSTLLLANCSVTGNVAQQNSIIHEDNPELSVVRSSKLAGVNQAILYCCNNMFPTHSPNGDICSFPACSEGCQEGTGCDCPYEYPFLHLNSCHCEDGYFGSNCESFNCSSSNCTNNSHCSNTSICTCDDGYEGVGVLCLDIDECRLNSSYCEGGTCNNTAGNYECICSLGYVGTYPNCTIGNECNNSTQCTYFANKCVTVNGTDLCICKPGYEGDFYNCTDINECDSILPCGVANATCYNTEGSFNCTCPAGFRWNGTICTVMKSSKCGDGICSSADNETCVSCFVDCPYPSCGLCGDGVCDGNETCSNCFADCSYLCPLACPTCRNGGTCTSTGCICTGDWTGPACTNKRHSVAVDVSPTAPVASLVSREVNTTQFSVGIRKIVELDNVGNIVSEIILSEAFDLVELRVINASRNSQWIFSAKLFNKAQVTVIFHVFKEPKSNYTFYNQTFTYKKNTLKLSVQIDDWPFQSVSNVLQVYIENNATNTVLSGEVAEVETSYDDGGSLKWLQITLNDVSEYVQFIPYAVVDNRTRYIQFTQTDNMIIASLPSFFKFAVIDPDFSVLVSQDSKENSASKKNLIIVIAVVTCGVFGLAIIFGLTYYRLRGRINVFLRVKRSKKRVIEGLESTTSSSQILKPDDL